MWLSVYDHNYRIKQLFSIKIDIYVCKTKLSKIYSLKVIDLFCVCTYVCLSDKCEHSHFFNIHRISLNLCILLN